VAGRKGVTEGGKRWNLLELFWLVEREAMDPNACSGSLPVGERIVTLGWFVCAAYLRLR